MKVVSNLLFGAANPTVTFGVAKKYLVFDAVLRDGRNSMLMLVRSISPE
jgi:hypothetical protein